MKNFTISIFLLLGVCLISTAFIEKNNDVCVVGNSSQMIGVNNNIQFAMSNSLVVGTSNAIGASNNSILGGANNGFDGENSMLIGRSSEMNGNNSYGFGQNVRVLGDDNFAAGTSINISGENSYGFGNAATVGNDGCFVFNSIDGPNNSPPNPPAYLFGTISSGDNGQSIFNSPGGFYIYYDQFGTNLSLVPGFADWTSISDKNKKHNFYKLDPANILDKYRVLDNHTTWSYKDHNVRNYGPMAQDFYAAFGEDGYGKIGTDTTISTHNIASVNLIAVHELEKRTRLQKEQLDTQAETITALTEEVEMLKEANGKIAKLEEKLKQITATLEL